MSVSVMHSTQSMFESVMGVVACHVQFSYRYMFTKMHGASEAPEL
jgi:hypothetical protein